MNRTAARITATLDFHVNHDIPFCSIHSAVPFKLNRPLCACCSATVNLQLQHCALRVLYCTLLDCSEQGPVFGTNLSCSNSTLLHSYTTARAHCMVHAVLQCRLFSRAEKTRTMHSFICAPPPACCFISLSLRPRIRRTNTHPLLYRFCSSRLSYSTISLAHL